VANDLLDRASEDGLLVVLICEHLRQPGSQALGETAHEPVAAAVVFVFFFLLDDGLLLLEHNPNLLQHFALFWCGVSNCHHLEVVRDFVYLRVETQDHYEQHPHLVSEALRLVLLEKGHQVVFVLTRQAASCHDLILDILQFVKRPSFDILQDPRGKFDMHVDLLLLLCHLRQLVNGCGQV